MKLTTRFLTTLLLLSSSTHAINAAEVEFDRIEAVVNKELILKSDLVAMKHDVIMRYQEKNQALPKDLDKQILNKLINDKLQLQVANTIGLRINDIRLNQAIESIAKQKHQSIAQMQVEIEKSGSSYAAFVDNVRNEITINEVRQVEVRKRINLSEQEIEQMVKRINEQGQQTAEFNFSHIMLRESAKDSPKKKLAIDTKAAQLVEQLKQGADVNQLAKANSQGPKASNGGNWGWRKLDKMPSLFAEQLKKEHKKGDIIGPFRSGQGLHIIKILDKKGDQNIMKEEVKARHILIKPTIILNDGQAKQLLSTLRDEIINGKKDFADVAKQYSEDPGSAVKGGDLGWADPSIYVPEFRDAALTQSIGEISQPFRTSHGWHLLQVLKKRKADITKKATQQKAYGILFNQRFPAEAAAWVNEIRQQAYVKITNPDYIIEEE